MQSTRIYFEADDELSEYESVSKGYRNDIFIELEGEYYHIRAYTITRLKQDFEVETEQEGYFLIEPNLILVKETSKQEIVQAINYLYERGYFNKIKTSEREQSINLVQIQ